MQGDVELLKKYIFAEAQSADCNPEDTSSYWRVKSFFEYRNIRIKQAWYAMITKGENNRQIAVERNELDSERRHLHNTALNSVLGFDKISKIFDLEPIYNGRKLTPEQIESHDTSSLDIRKEMTDWFFGLVNEIYDYYPEKTKDNYNKENKFIESLKSDVYKFDREYGVQDPIREDDGDVIFSRKDEKGIW